MYNGKQRIPYGYGTKRVMFAVQREGSISDDTFKEFFCGLMTPEDEHSGENYEPHSLVFYNPGKVSLTDVRAAADNIEHARKYYSGCEIVKARVCGYGITKPALVALEDACHFGYNIQFIDLT